MTRRSENAARCAVPAAVCAAVLAVAPGLAAQRNLLVDPSFERGLAAWQRLGDDAARSAVATGGWHGSHCWQTEGGGGVRSQPVSVEPGQVLTLSAWGRTEGARGVRLELRTAGGQRLGAPARLPPAQPTWARIQTVATVPAGVGAVTAVLRGEGGRVAWDAVQLESGAMMTRFEAGGANLVVNSGFEDGALGWQVLAVPTGGGTARVEDGAGRGGGAAMHARAAADQVVVVRSGWLRCRPGGSYTVSGFARAGGTRRARIEVWTADAAGRVLQRGDEAVAVPAEVPSFARFSQPFALPAGAASVLVQLVCSGGEVWWDDIQLERGAHATEVSVTPADVVLPDVTPSALSYARAVVREARLGDAVESLRRLHGYRGAPAATGDALSALLPRLEKLSAPLGPRRWVPDWQGLDYAAWNASCARLEESVTALWRQLGADPDLLWPPAPAPGRPLANRFCLFPNVMRTAWFRGRSRWALLQPFGFDLVATWGAARLDPEGRLDTAVLEDIARSCAVAGVHCDLAVDGGVLATGALRPRLGEVVFLHGAGGVWSPAGRSHGTANFWHPQVRAMALDGLRQLAAWGASRPELVAWELCNEPSLSIEDAGSGRRLGAGGYSAQAAAAWRQWLRARYRGVEELNATWRTEHADFDAIEPPAMAPPRPRDGTTAVAAGALADFQRFRAESHADWLAAGAGALRSPGPSRPVVSQLFADLLDRPDAGLDLLAMVDRGGFDVLGTHDWPAGGPAVSSLFVASVDDRARLPQWSDELIWSQGARRGTPEAVVRAVLRRNVWRQVAWGKRAIELFNLATEWRPGTPRSWNNSLLDVQADLAVPRYSAGVIPALQRKLDAVPELLATRLAFDRAAVLRPTTSWRVAAPAGITRRETTALVRAMLVRHVVPRVLPEEWVARGSELPDLRLLAVGGAPYLPRAVQDRLLRWVRDGGLLVAVGPPGLFDEHGNPAGQLLEAAFGVLPWRFAGGRWHVETPRLERLGELEVLRAELGAGRVVLCVGLGDAGAAALLEPVLAPALGGLPVRTTVKNLEIVPRVGPSGQRYLFVTNLAIDRRRVGMLSLRDRCQRAVDLLCAGFPAVPVAERHGRSDVAIALEPGSAALLRLE